MEACWYGKVMNKRRLKLYFSLHNRNATQQLAQLYLVTSFVCFGKIHSQYFFLSIFNENKTNENQQAADKIYLPKTKRAKSTRCTFFICVRKNSAFVAQGYICSDKFAGKV